MNIADHAFLICGGASGLGAACARRLAADGARVMVADVNEAIGMALVAELGSAASFVRCDVTDEASVQGTIDATRAAFSRFDGVLQCAGILGASRVVGRAGPHDLALFRRVVEVNLIGTFNVLRLAAASLAGNPPEADGERGVIVNTSSVAAFEGQIGQAAYSASKGGVASLTLPAARELGSLGIRVVAIAPGTFDTPMMAGVSEEVRGSLGAQVPFPKRLGRPEEFAALVTHIIENVMLNGAVLRLDGGIRMGGK
ncbi:MAG: SDR family oxidoreductase [Planctomycetia bacterium]|nr:SDR family oxidoreductase [Planctomycetia bacterium]